MASQGRSGSIASLICDAGERYHDTLFAPGWIAAQGLDTSAALQDSADPPLPAAGTAPPPP